MLYMHTSIRELDHMSLSLIFQAPVEQLTYHMCLHINIPTINTARDWVTTMNS